MRADRPVVACPRRQTLIEGSAWGGRLPTPATRASNGRLRVRGGLVDAPTVADDGTCHTAQTHMPDAKPRITLLTPLMLTIRQVLPEGVYHWNATHPEWDGPVSAYAIDDGERLILVDPIAVPDEVAALYGSREVVTVLTSTWHARDAATLGFPVWAPAPDRPEDQLVAATRYAIGDVVFGMKAYPGREGQLDLVLWSDRI